MTLIRNPVLLLAIGLPALAVLGSFASLAVSLDHRDTELPEQYHWEGFQLDRDFSRSQQATSLGVRATLNGVARTGECSIDLQIAGTAPEQLSLTLAHATMASLDRRIELRREPDTDRYVGRCTALAADGHWRLELMDAARSWSVRDSVRGLPDQLLIDATTTDDD
jgi:hypothetical protein